MKVAAIGRTEWLYNALVAVRERRHDVVLIGTCPAAPEYTRKEDDFQRLAAEIGCPFFCDRAINRPEQIAAARASGAEIAITVNWPTRLRAEILEQFRHGLVNAHVGDVPRFRGNATTPWAILAGESRVVLTLHRMDVGLDTGPILLQRICPLSDSTYVSDVYRFLDCNIPAMFVELLDRLEAGTLAEQAQPADPELSLRCFPRLPRDSEIQWNRPATELARLVRASAEPFAGAYTHVGTEKVIVWRAHPEQPAYQWLGAPGQVAEVRPASGEVAVLTADGFLVLETVETGGSGRVPAAVRFRSARTRFGFDPAAELSRLQSCVNELQERLKTQTHPSGASLAPSPKLSIVIPVYNEGDGLKLLASRLKGVLPQLETEFEVLFIDDHSTDDSPEVLNEICRDSPEFRHLRLSRNCGSHVAILAGLEHARGDCAVFMAADLQDPPELIGKMLERWRQGNSTVWAVRAGREGIPLLDRAFARAFYWLLNRFGEVSVPPDGADFALIDRAVISALLRSAGANPSLFCEIAKLGFRQAEMPYVKEARRFGGTKWNLRKRLKLFADTFVAFSYAPLRTMSYLGLALSGVGFLYALFVIVMHISTGWHIQGWASLMVIVLTIGGVQMIMLGVLGEYLWRTLDVARHRPNYFIEGSCGVEEPPRREVLSRGQR